MRFAVNLIVKGLIIVIFVSGFWYINHTALKNIYGDIYVKYFPCQKPITYRVGPIDPRFGISETEFKEEIDTAAHIWEEPINRNLFEYSPKGEVEISLVYDDRQAATEKLKSLGLVVKENKASYDQVKNKYDILQSKYLREKAAYETDLKNFQKAKAAYDARVSAWNKKGGAPHNEYVALEAERMSLENKFADIKNEENELNKDVADINATVPVLNRLASILNLGVAEFNKVGNSNGKEFTAGLYETGPNGKTIHIYQFDSKDNLVRVLAHELGHALGLPHLDNPKSIMYRLNEGVNDIMTPDDLAALKTECKIK